MLCVPQLTGLDQAHDRFGYSAMRSCAEKCITYRDYWLRGLQTSIGFFAVSLVSLLILTVTKTVQYGTFVSQTYGAQAGLLSSSDFRSGDTRLCVLCSASNSLCFASPRGTSHR